MPFRQIDLTQISTTSSSNNQVLAVVSNNIVWANVSTVYTPATAFGYSIIFGG
jgi:hypothetical protein